MPISSSDRAILRDLSKRVADIAADPIQKQREAMWVKLNGLQKTRPLVRAFQIPWNEMNVDDELTLRTEDPWSRRFEDGLRKTIYQWEHMPDDQVIEETVWCVLAVGDTGFGIVEDADVTTESGIASRSFHEQIETLDDLEKIKMPEVTHNEAASQQGFEMLSELFGDIRPVRQRGISHLWFAPWDLLITWYGVERALLDMVLNPDLVNGAISRLVEAYLYRLAQWEQLNVLSLTTASDSAGSGGLSVTDELPQPGYDPARITTQDLWGCATPQIFSEVSPDMHWEFALRHEMRWLEKWGLNYYGCCEPLHTKVEILRRIPNLRKVSVSPMCDKRKMGEQIAGQYVASLKPNPALLAMNTWNPELARSELRTELQQLDGCVVEIIMKDISTVLFEPRRLWEWVKIAIEVAEEFA